MKQSITNNMTEDDSKEMKMLFKESYRVRNRLIELLEDKASAAHRASLSTDGYSNLSWAYQQADTIGYQRGIRDAISLLTS